MSLKSILIEEIKKAGYLSQNEVEAICKREGKKISNAERRLRPSESGEFVEEVRSGKAIIGYRAKVKINPITQILIDHKAKLAESQRVKELQTSLF